MSTADRLRALFEERIAVFDGAWGTMIQARGLTAEDYRGARFRDRAKDVAGDPDVLSLTRPDVVRSIHDAYLAAGADITTTNTFTATSIGQADYGLQDAVREINQAAARIAREACDAVSTPGPPTLRRRLAGAAQRDAVTVAAGGGSRVSSRRLRRGGGRLRRADSRARRRRRGLPHPGDRLRHAQREGRDRGRAGRGAPACRSSCR